MGIMMLKMFSLEVKEVMGNNSDLNKKSGVQLTNHMDPPESEYLVDSRDGNEYSIVDIGGQIWMSENLRYIGYSNDSKHYSTYGGLYSWWEAQSVCPSGWHLPSDEEWQRLIRFLGGEKIAGARLKDTQSLLWQGQNSSNSSSSGFNALPAGYGNALSKDKLEKEGELARFWSSITSSGFEGTWAYYYQLHYKKGSMKKTNHHKDFKMSVRCTKDY